MFNRDPYSHRRGKQASRLKTDTPLQCALYDFQYVGLGLGVLDLIYFLGTSVESNLLSTQDSETELLNFYHSQLLEKTSEPHIYPYDTFLRHWELAIVDWYRFMAGWGFWGNDGWVERRAREITSKWNADSSAWTFPS